MPKASYVGVVWNRNIRMGKIINIYIYTHTYWWHGLKYTYLWHGLTRPLSRSQHFCSHTQTKVVFSTESAYACTCTICTLSTTVCRTNSLYTFIYIFFVTHTHKAFCTINRQLDPVGCCWECGQYRPIHCYGSVIFQSQCQSDSELKVAMVIKSVTHDLTMTHMSPSHRVGLGTSDW